MTKRLKVLLSILVVVVLAAVGGLFYYQNQLKSSADTIGPYTAFSHHHTGLNSVFDALTHHHTGIIISPTPTPWVSSKPTPWVSPTISPTPKISPTPTPKPPVPISSVPVVTTSEVTSITATSAVLRGNIVSTSGMLTIGRGFQYGLVKIADGAGAAGWSYDAGSFPVGAYSTSTTTLTAGLRIQPNTTYFVRAIAKNAKGTGYGNWVEFKTRNSTVPVVSTGSVSRITSNSATFQGALADTGGLPTTLRGFQYSLTQLPVGAGSAGYTYDTGSYQPGIFTRSTSPLMQGSLPLKANTVYYVRAIARNSQGAGYGNWVQFKTNYAWWWPF